MQDVDNVEKWKQKLLVKMRNIGERCEWVHDSWGSLTVTLLKTLSSFACERRIKHLLENANFIKENQRFDPYYRQKSQFATVKILEHIKTRLSIIGSNAGIMTEVPSEIGRYDVVITQGCPCKVYANGEERIRIEMKASLGLDLGQIERYLWDPSPLILVRVITRHVVKIGPSRLRSYVLFSLRELNAKADRILSGKFYTVPRTACTICYDTSCPHNRIKRKQPRNIVTMSDGEFADDLELFFKNLGYVAERTADLVIEELKGVIPSHSPCASAPITARRWMKRP